ASRRCSLRALWQARKPVPFLWTARPGSWTSPALKTRARPRRRSVVGLTRQELAQAVALAGGHPPAIDGLVRALDACDAERFGPSRRGDEAPPSPPLAPGQPPPAAPALAQMRNV